MQKAISLCLERVADSEGERFIRCTARSGRDAGLAIGLDGSILWCSQEPAACDIWVTGDGRLVVVRAATDQTMRLERGRRVLELPEGRAVVVLDEDSLVVQDRRFVVHVHGPTDKILPPQPLRLGRGALVAAAMSLAVGCGADDETIGIPVGGSSSTSAGRGGQESAESATVGTISISLGGTTATTGGTSGSGGTIEVVDFPPFVS